MVSIAFIAGVSLYSQMPNEMVSHWNARGEADGFMPKFWGLFLMPIVSLVLFFLFLLIPKIDPLKKNIEKFRKYFNVFITLVIFFLFYIHLLSLLFNLGYRFNMGKMITPILGVLIFYSGVLIAKAKRNWFIGIRTPWTLSNDVVWEKTHKIGAKLFKICGMIIVLSILLPSQIIWWFLIILVISINLFLVIYSYFIFKKL